MSGEQGDTFAEWLFQRLMSDAPFKSDAAQRQWAELSGDDRAWVEHEAAAVRRAVERDGFRP